MVQKKKPVTKKTVLDKPSIAKKVAAKTTKSTTTKTTKAVPKKRTVISGDDSDVGMGSTPPEAKKQKKGPVPRKPISKAKPSQSKGDESEVDGNSSDAPNAEGKKNSGDAYQKVCTISFVCVTTRYANTALL